MNVQFPVTNRLNPYIIIGRMNETFASQAKPNLHDVVNVASDLITDTAASASGICHSRCIHHFQKQ